MQKINLPRLNASPSRLGFGCMRLPTTAQGDIDEVRAQAMLRRAFDAGVNYFDTAYFYHNHMSEAFLGRALKQFAREDFYLATKLPMSIIDTLDKAKAIFEEQLQKLNTPYFDFYLLHALNGARFRQAKALGIVDFLEQEQRRGRIRRLGFSFHDNYDAFSEILHARRWDFCQIQFNYMDVDFQAGMRGYELAHAMDVPVFVMEPVKGGSLAAPGDEVTAMMRAAHPDWSPASWALRWVASLPGCAVILSGMSAEEQLEDNLATFDAFTPLTPADQAVIERVRETLRAKMFVGCTGCKYCLPCPFGVAIPDNFQMMNDYTVYGAERRLKNRWADMEPAARASACRRCGQCEKACPQGLPIREKLAEIAMRMA